MKTVLSEKTARWPHQSQQRKDHDKVVARLGRDVNQARLEAGVFAAELVVSGKLADDQQQQQHLQQHSEDGTGGAGGGNKSPSHHHTSAAFLKFQDTDTKFDKRGSLKGRTASSLVHSEEGLSMVGALLLLSALLSLSRSPPLFLPSSGGIAFSLPYLATFHLTSAASRFTRTFSTRGQPSTSR
jgi:hypothetical protein